MSDTEQKSTQALLDLLMEAGALSADVLTQEQALLQQHRDAGEKALEGLHLRLNQATQVLHIQRFPGAESLADLPLPFAAHRFSGDNWLQSGQDILLLQQDTHKKADAIRYTPLENTADAQVLELLLSPLGTFVKASRWTEANLPLSAHGQWSIKPRQEIASGPLDLHVSPDQKQAAVVNRYQGKLVMVDLSTLTLGAEIDLRKPGSDRGLHVHFYGALSQLIVTDHSSSIGRWQYDGTALERLSPGAGILGASVLSPAQGLLFALSTRPSPGLKVIDLSSGELQKEVAIKGDLYSVRSDAPYDLMALHPDENSLVFMTYLNEPEPFTPVISVVDTQRQKTTQRYALKDGTRPTMLCFEALNPLASKNQSILEILQSKNHISLEDLHSARIALREREQAEAEANAPAPQMLDMDQRAYEEAQEQAEEAEQNTAEENADEAPAFKPEKASQMNISPVADELIVNHCIQDIKAKTLGQIRLDDEEQAEDYANHLERLKAAAMRARNELEWHTGAVIKLRDFLDGKTYEKVILREEMEQMLHKHERDSLVTSGMPTVPSNCPNCSKPLFGSYVCSYCGYEIERPEEMLKKGLISIATLTPVENLVPGHFLLIDIEGKRILEIDTERNLIWTVGKDLLSEGSIELNFPRDAVRLTNRNTLITDMSAGRVLEMTPSGRLFWEYQAKGDEKQLKSPVRATANGLGNILIVDQGRHRVIEVSHQSEILNQFGMTDQYGIAEDYLNMPSDAQRLVNGNILITDTGNHRVIELEERQIVWQYGNPENADSGAYGSEDGFLSYPQSALRLPNGNTLIVDAGNLRLIEVDPEGKILWQHRTDQGEEEHQMDSPFRAAYVPKENLVMLLSENAVIELRPTPDKPDKANAENRALAQEVVWGCRLSQFERAKVQLKQTQTTRQFVARHGVKNPYLRTQSQEGSEASAAAQKRLQEMIDQRLARSRQGQQNKAHVTRFDQGKPEALGDLEFFMLERSRSRILRTDRDGQLSWRYGESEAQALNKPHACTRTAEGHVLIADTDNHRILEVNPENNEVVWSFGEKGQAEQAERGLDRPRFAQILPNQRVLIVDQNNRRVFEMKKNRQIMWEYAGMDNLMVPYHAERLDNGNTLITDWGAHWVIEVSPEKEVVWSFGERKTSGNDASHLSYPEHATRLSNGHTLICDTRNHRVLEVNPAGEVVWELDGQDRVKYGTPTYAQRFDNGNTLILHSSNRQMLEVTAKSQLMWKLMLPFERSTPSTATQATAKKADDA